MASSLPNYVAAATPVPQANRIPWYKSTAQTYAGIMLWFVFWQDMPVGAGIDKAHGAYSAFAGGTLSQGLLVAFIGLIAAALICHFLFYLVPGMLGLKTGLPLYIVGTSTYGVRGGFLMPGFLMGILQFGWLGVNAFFSAWALCAPFGIPPLHPIHAAVAAIWAIAAAFMGLKGIQYVAKVASFLPLIPLAVLVILFVATAGGIGKFSAEKVVDAGKTAQIMDKNEKGEAVPAKDPDGQPLKAQAPLSTFGVIALLATYIIGFFATAGAAGVDFGMNNRDARDVQLGGLWGIAVSTIFAGGLALLITAGAYGQGIAPQGVLQAKEMMGPALGSTWAAAFNWLLAIAAFPPACFSAFIAANSFKTTLPKVNPFISVGIGTAVSIALAVTGYAGQATEVFSVIGASFGPICGAMIADYLLSGRKWAGPRAGFNPAGWISWAVGFVVGAADLLAKYVPQLAGLKGIIPVPPLSALVVGFVLFFVLAALGLQTRKLEMPQASESPAAAG